MGLTSSLYIGQSALAASQLALQVTGNNLANAATPGYHRQRVGLAPTPGQQVGPRQYAGRGVGVQEIRRLIDPALTARLRDSISAESAATTDQSLLDQVETITSASGAGGNDLSGLLGTFFNSFSELANNPATPTARAAVIEQGAALAAHLRDVRSQLVSQRGQVDLQLTDAVGNANDITKQIAALNRAIVTAEGGQGGNNGEGNLRDQRDRLLSQLGELMDITVNDSGNGSVDVLVNSIPIVLGGDSRDLEARFRTVNGTLQADVLSLDPGASGLKEVLSISSGRIGALLANRGGTIQKTIDDADQLASCLIFEVNKLHSLGRPSARITDITGTQVVPTADQGLAFNDPANATFAKLPFKVSNGSFDVRITDSNGNTSTKTISVDLDGLTAAGAPGFTGDSSLATITAALNGVPNLHAQITGGGQLRLYTDAGYDVSFGNDSSGVLAVLGVNSFFTGTDGQDIAVRTGLQTNPAGLAIGHNDGGNEVALGIAALRGTKIEGAGDQSLNDLWAATTGRNAVRLQSANTRAEALGTVRQSLEAQEGAISGVSTDEESINLITYQQQYQGAARFIGVINDLTQVLLQLV